MDSPKDHEPMNEVLRRPIQEVRMVSVLTEDDDPKITEAKMESVEPTTSHPLLQTNEAESVCFHMS